MTDDTALSTPPASPADTPERREQFAQYTAVALGEWMAAEPWQRQAIGRIAPALAQALWMADMVIDEMIGDEIDEEGAQALMRELVGLPDPEPLLARLRRCTETIALPDEGTFAYCGTRLVGGACPFAAHHAITGG
jgi:hypothetical protein